MARDITILQLTVSSSWFLLIVTSYKPRWRNYLLRQPKILATPQAGNRNDSIDPLITTLNRVIFLYIQEINNVFFDK